MYITHETVKINQQASSIVIPQVQTTAILKYTPQHTVGIATIRPNNAASEPSTQDFGLSLGINDNLSNIYMYVVICL